MGVLPVLPREPCPRRRRCRGPSGSTTSPRTASRTWRGCRPTPRAARRRASPGATAFSASGRPAMVGLPDVAAGEVAELSGVLSKDRTSDDLTFTVLRPPPARFVPGRVRDGRRCRCRCGVSVVPVTAAGGVDATRQREVVERDTGADRWCVQTPDGDAGLRGDRGRRACCRLVAAVRRGDGPVRGHGPAHRQSVRCGCGDAGGPAGHDVGGGPLGGGVAPLAGAVRARRTTRACGAERVPVQVPVELFAVNTATHPRRAHGPVDGPRRSRNARLRGVGGPAGRLVGWGRRGHGSRAGRRPAGAVADAEGLGRVAGEDQLAAVAHRPGWVARAAAAAADRGGVVLGRRDRAAPGVVRRGAWPAGVRASGRGQTGPDTELAVRVNGPGWGAEQGYLGVGNQGWGVAGYRADGTRRAAPLRRSDFDLTPPGGFGDGEAGEAKACASVLGADRCQADARVPDGPPAFTQNPSNPGGGLPGTGRDAPAAYLFLPRLVDAGCRCRRVVVGRSSRRRQHHRDHDGRGPADRGPRTPRGRTRHPQRLVLVRATGDLAAPVRLGQVAPHLGAAGGVGPLSASASVGWSSATVGYLDLNGDRFPDLVMPGLVAYTNPRGGSTCPLDGNRYGPCAVRDSVAAGQLGSQFSVATGVGLNGSVASIGANAAGQSNVTRGQSAGRGGKSSGSSYGGRGSVAGGVQRVVVGAAGVRAHRRDGRRRGRRGLEWSRPRVRPAAAPPSTISGWCNATWPMSTATGCPTRSRSMAAGLGVRFNTGYGFTGQWLPWAAQIGFESGESYGGHPRRWRLVRDPGVRVLRWSVADREGRLRPLHLDRRQRRRHPRRALPRRRGHRGAGAGALRHRAGPRPRPRVYGTDGGEDLRLRQRLGRREGLDRPAGPPGHLGRVVRGRGLHRVGAAVRADPGVLPGDQPRRARRRRGDGHRCRPARRQRRRVPRLGDPRCRRRVDGGPVEHPRQDRAAQVGHHPTWAGPSPWTTRGRGTPPTTPGRSGP